jgi:predicted negative regulator of RcsB-dependent stress response
VGVNHTWYFYNYSLPGGKRPRQSDKVEDARKVQKGPVVLTRHELKEQLQHDAFRDNVDVAVDYVATHRRQVIRWTVIALVIAVAAGVTYGIYQYQKTQREKALQAAMVVVEAPVEPKPDGFGKTFTTQQAKDQAAMKALSDVAARYSGSEQGDAAQYMLAGLQASNSKYSEAERNFKAVADASSEYSALAKIGLAQLYAGEGKNQQAKTILEGLVAHPTAMVSKEQATLLLASVVKDTDPKRAKQLAESLKVPTERAAVERAAGQIATDAK